MTSTYCKLELLFYCPVTVPTLNKVFLLFLLLLCSGADQRKHQGFPSLAICEGNPPLAGGSPSQRVSNVEKLHWWLHQEQRWSFWKVLAHCSAAFYKHGNTTWYRNTPCYKIVVFYVNWPSYGCQISHESIVHTNQAKVACGQFMTIEFPQNTPMIYIIRIYMQNMSNICI